MGVASTGDVIFWVSINSIEQYLRISIDFSVFSFWKGHFPSICHFQIFLTYSKVVSPWAGNYISVPTSWLKIISFLEVTMGWEIPLWFPYPKWSSSPHSRSPWFWGIWSSPCELCRILLARPRPSLASPSQYILPPVVSVLTPSLMRPLTTSTLDMTGSFTPWAGPLLTALPL